MPPPSAQKSVISHQSWESQRALPAESKVYSGLKAKTNLRYNNRNGGYLRGRGIRLDADGHWDEAGSIKGRESDVEGRGNRC